MDFYKIVEKTTKNGIDVFPDFKVTRSKDLMVRGKSFYAIWDEERGLWNTDEYVVQQLVDEDLRKTREKLGPICDVKWMGNFSTNSWRLFRQYMQNISDSSHQLDEKLTFSNTEVKKTDYVSKRLPYPIEDVEIPAYEEIMSTLYDPAERDKLEWAIGAIIAGDSKNIQKFLVLYGPAGSGKSTILNIIQMLFKGYYTTFEAKQLTSSSNAFSTEPFKMNPLVAIQHDGDLSKIEDNTKLNSIVSHEEIVINEKYKPGYMSRINAFLFMGTNKPVKITDAKSGIIRRLIDVHPSGNLIPTAKYHILLSQINFELGGIANRCLKRYRELGKDYYAGYLPVEMILQTDFFYNFIEQFFETFNSQDGTNLDQAYGLYKKYCEESNVEYKLPRHKFREELRNYFDNFYERLMVDGTRQRSVYRGFKKEKFTSRVEETEHAYSLSMKEDTSLLDEMLADMPAQLATEDGIPKYKWANVSTKLSDIDTGEVHYVKPPSNHIVIDFDLKGDDGKKSVEKNVAEASLWPSTYAEFSQGGSGVHLHYIWTGDPTELSRVYSDGIEIKVFTGDASLRRKLSTCNNIPVVELSSGLPMKEKKVINFDTVKSERGLRDLIERNLRKEIHPGTKPSIDFINKLLEDAYKEGLSYDVSNLRPQILSFAMNSTNQSDYCIKLVNKMRWVSEGVPWELAEPQYISDTLVFFDVEVFPNLFHISWKYQGSDQCVHMVNPTPAEMDKFLKLKLVGYNNRRYDNHICYARYLGYSLEQLYSLSQKLVTGSKNGYFGEAYEASYTDIYDFASEKKSLKKWQIELGIHHKELGLPWDKPVPEEMWDLVAEYCDNDVISEEIVFEARKQDFVAREILAKVSGLSVNRTTNQHTTRIIFGHEKNPQDSFIYTDLSEMFPGYKHDFGKSTYRGEETGEGGYVYSEPGMYNNVAVLDVASMHPTSIEELELFGPYTKKFSELKAARVAIKRKEYEAAGSMLGGALRPYLVDEGDAKALSYALKIAINSVYGLTSARFPNPFKDPRNIDNIVAKRGALFMIDLKNAVQAKGVQVVHIKTDSIKIPDATPEIIQFVMEFGEKYGYEFEHETTYEKMCLVNDAVYIAKVPADPWAANQSAKWSATGAQFAHPYVFKTLFSKEQIHFDDLCETKSVTTALYLDFENGTKPMFIGKIGAFVPILPNRGGALLLREKEDKFYAATGSKGHYWLEGEMVKELHKEDDIDMSYFSNLVDNAIETLSKFGDFESFAA